MQTVSFFISAIGPYERAFKRRGAKTAEERLKGVDSYESKTSFGAANKKPSRAEASARAAQRAAFLLTGTDRTVIG